MDHHISGIQNGLTQHKATVHSSTTSRDRRVAYSGTKFGPTGILSTKPTSTWPPVVRQIVTRTIYKQCRPERVSYSHCATGVFYAREDLLHCGFIGIDQSSSVKSWSLDEGRVTISVSPNFVPECAMRLSLLVVDECTMALCCVNPFWIPDM